MEDNNPNVNEPKEEVTPEWATKLQNSLSELTETIKGALTPSEPQPQPQPDPTQPIEIVLPQEPQPEPQPQPEQMTEPEQEQEKPKKRSLLDWLF